MPSTPSSCCTGPTGSAHRSAVVGIVIVSHSATLAAGVRGLAAEMSGPDVRLELAGGLDEPEALGTDAVRVADAIARADSGDGVLVLMDLGSAVLSAETALDLLTPEQKERVLLCEAPLVEGAVAAAVAARLGTPLAEVAAEARGGLQGKAAHLGSGEPEGPAPAAAPPPEQGPSLRLDIRNPLGLHARPAARFVQTAGSFEADVQVTNLTSGRGPASGRSLNGLATLGVRQGHEILVSASGPQAAAALDALAELARRDFDALLEPARRAIFEHGRNAAEAWHAAAESVAADYRSLDDDYLQARAEDLVGVARQVVAAITGGFAAPSLAGPGIVVAADLTPADTAALNRDLALGIATAAGSPTSHSAILARSLGIPAAVGLGDRLLAVPDGTPLLLDGDAGVVQVEPAEELVAEYERRRSVRREAAREAQARAAEPALTRDG